MTVAFEGEVRSGDRHAHILAYVPPSMKRRTSHEMMIGLFPGDFRYLWAKLKRNGNKTPKRQRQKIGMVRSDFRAAFWTRYSGPKRLCGQRPSPRNRTFLL